MLAIQRAGDSDITDISSMTSVADIFTNPKSQNSLVRTWVLFDGHEDTLTWTPRQSLGMTSMQLSLSGQAVHSQLVLQL